MSLPPFAVPGVEPETAAAGLSSVGYRGDQLAAQPAVAAVLARFPDELTTPEGDTLTREALAEQVHVSTGSGVRWGLGFDDEVGDLVQPRRGRAPSDWLREALAAEPGVVAADHFDRESFTAETAEPLRADEMMARWLSAILTAHRSYAAYAGHALPY